MNSYNNAISTLNTRAMAYLNTTYASDARCVGSVPNNKNSQSGYYTIPYFTSSYSGKLRGPDDNYETDMKQMAALEIGVSDTVYWLASRNVDGTTNIAFKVNYVLHPSVELTRSTLCHVYSSGTVASNSMSLGLRPVFTLKPGIKVTGGSGTINDPYTLGT